MNSAEFKEDLVRGILLFLPPKSVTSLKLLSHRWMSIISDPNFVLSYIQRNPGSVSGILFAEDLGRWFVEKTVYTQVSLDEESPSSFKRQFRVGTQDLKILQECKGLLLCCATKNVSARNAGTKMIGAEAKLKEAKFYVLNPATNNVCSFPSPSDEKLNFMNLVYDKPSLGYMVVCVQCFRDSHYRIQIYSSDKGNWELCPQSYDFDLSTKLARGVFWNGALHWFDDHGHIYRFEIDKKSLEFLPSPSIFADARCCVRFLGESEGHLYLVAFDKQVSRYIIFEMAGDMSGWMVKYELDKNIMHAAFSFSGDDSEYFRILVLSVVEFKLDGPTLVMVSESNRTCKSGQVVGYHLEKNTYKYLYTFQYERNCCGAFKYIESLSII